MAINFPTGLDDFTDYTDGSTVLIAATLNNMQLGIEANQVKIGIDSSAVTTSHDYKLANIKFTQMVNVLGPSYVNCTTAVPIDDTIPQITEGDTCMTLAITPVSATSKLRIDVVAMLRVPGANYGVAALFQDATASALSCGWMSASAASGSSVCFTHWMTSGTTGATTFTVRCGGNATIGFSGTGSRLFGGVAGSSLSITEIVP